jgi:hypothetical protein
MPLEDVAHGLVTDGVAQVGEGPNDPVIAPGAIRLGHTDHQVLDLLVNTRTAYGLKDLRGVNRLVSTLTVPGEDGFRLGNGGNLSQGLLPQFGAKLSEFLTLAVGQLYTAVDLVA